MSIRVYNKLVSKKKINEIISNIIRTNTIIFKCTTYYLVYIML